MLPSPNGGLGFVELPRSLAPAVSEYAAASSRLSAVRHTLRMGRRGEWSSAGFTVLELLVGVTLGTLVAGFALTYLRSQRASLRYQEEVVDLQERARVALEVITRDLRQARYPSATASRRLLTALPAEVAFEVGTNANPADLDTLTFKLDGSVLRRKVQNDGTGGFQQLVTNVKGLTLTYYDSAGVVTTEGTAVRRVAIEVTIESTGYVPNSGRKRALTMRTAVALRNMTY